MIPPGITRYAGTVTNVSLSHPDHKFSLRHVNLAVEEKSSKGSYLRSYVPVREIPRYIGLKQRVQLPVDKPITGLIFLDSTNQVFDRLDQDAARRQVVFF